MENFNNEYLTASMGLIGGTIIVAALLSGWIERSGLPQVSVFIALGAVLGAPGLGILNIALDSPTLRIIAIVSLVLVLFTDAVSLNINEVKRHVSLAFRVLGPGTLLSSAAMAYAGVLLLDLSWPAAIMLGAALASTDPVLLRGLLRRPNLSENVRLPLRLESGLNDIVLLPLVLIAVAWVASKGSMDAQTWVHLGMDLFLLGPVAGIVVGLAGVSTLEMVRSRIGVRRDYESLYSLGIAFAAYAAAEAMHGSGFLAAFAAGLTIAALDVKLCDCFLEYGETTAEMALLFAFVLFGSSLIWSGLAVLDLSTLLFAVLTIVIRPATFIISLLNTPISWRERWLIAWFGPRGLSSLLLILLPVFAGITGSERLFAICCLVVLLSIAIHGGSLMLLKNKLPQQSSINSIITSNTNLTAASISINGFNTEDHSLNTISPDQVKALYRQGKTVFIVDSRGDKSYQHSDSRPKSSVRITSDWPVEQALALNLPRNAEIVTFCDCPNDESAEIVAAALRLQGWNNARALQGGWQAWQNENLPTEKK